MEWGEIALPSWRLKDAKRNTNLRMGVGGGMKMKDWHVDVHLRLSSRHWLHWDGLHLLPSLAFFQTSQSLFSNASLVV